MTYHNEDADAEGDPIRMALGRMASFLTPRRLVTARFRNNSKTADKNTTILYCTYYAIHAILYYAIPFPFIIIIQ